jgi:TP901 family phage tail tape measure protein
MVDDATIKVGSDVAGAIAGIVAIGTAVQALEGQVMAASAIIASATAAIGIAFVGVGVAAVGLATGGVALATDAFAEYEQTVANAASVTGEVGDAYDYARQNIEAISQELGANTVFSAQQAADAMYDLASAGYDVAAMVSGDLKPVMDLAAATQNDLTQTTEIVTATLGQFTLGIDSSDRVADVFAKTIGSSKATLDKIGLSFKYVGTIASQFGDSIEDTSAALAIMYNNGLRGEQAGRALRIAYGRLSNPTQDVIDVTGQLGLTLQDVNPQFHTMTEILQTLNDRGISVAQTMELFGVEAGTGMGAVLNNLPAMEALEQKFYDAGGAAEDMAEKQLDTLQGSLTLLKSILNIIAIEIGRRFAPYLRDVIQTFHELAQVVLNNVDPVFKTFESTMLQLEPALDNIISSAYSMYGIFQDLTSGGVGPLITAINTATFALALFLQFIDQHPNILKFAGVVAGAAIALEAYSLAVTVATLLSTAYAGALELVAAAYFIYSVAGGGAAGVTAILAALIGLIESPILIVVGAIGLLAGAWVTNFMGIRDITASFFDWFTEKVNWVADELTELIIKFNELSAAMGLDFRIDPMLMRELKDGYQEAADTVHDVVRDTKDSITGAFSLDEGGFGLFNMTDLDIANQTVEEMAANVEAMTQSQVAGAEAVDDMVNSYTSLVGDNQDSRLWDSSNQGVQSFGSYAEVAAARESGALKSGTVWEVNVNVGSVNNNDDSSDSLGSTVTQAVAEAGGL